MDFDWADWRWVLKDGWKFSGGENLGLCSLPRPQNHTLRRPRGASLGPRKQAASPCLWPGHGAGVWRKGRGGIPGVCRLMLDQLCQSRAGVACTSRAQGPALLFPWRCLPRTLELGAVTWGWVQGGSGWSSRDHWEALTFVIQRGEGH